MNPDSWFASWREGRIGFHEGAPNTFLACHEARLAGLHRVLVPLCGKAEDLAFLASRGHEVIGVELVEDAVRAFFAEHDLTPAITRRGGLAVYTAGAITVLAGDVFTVTRTDVGTIDAVYDRAALIALPPDVRPRYVAHLRMLIPAGTPGLLVTLEYPQDQMTGPPFAVPEPEVRALYARAELLDERAATGGRLATAGFAARERCFGITF